MSAAANEVLRLRRARTLFERAQTDGVDMAEARRRLHRERWEAINARLERKAASGLCGTQAPALDDPDGDNLLQWWQR